MSVLQLALDLPDLTSALAMAEAVHPHFDLAEVGTPLILEAGLAAVTAVRERFPDKQVLADTKIADAGYLEAAGAFRRGAHVVTVLGGADDKTIAGCLEAAREYDGEVMADLMHVADTVGRAVELARLGVPIVCLHTAWDRRHEGVDVLGELRAVRAAVDCRIAVAGGITLANSQRTAAAGADIVVVGGGIITQHDPRQAAADIVRSLAAAEREPVSTATSPELVARRVAAEVSGCLGVVDSAAVSAAVTAIAQAPRVFLAAAGRSALAIRGLAMRLMHLGRAAYVVGETTTPGLGSGDLLVIGSGSGRTASLVAHAQKARQLGAQVLLLTIDAQSPIAEVADCVVVIPAPSPKAAPGAAGLTSQQPMGSLFEQTLFLLCDSLVLLLMERLDRTADDMFGRHANLE